MEIRSLNETEYEDTKSLWDECFGDGGFFVDWYYKRRSRPEYVLAAFSDGRPISMLHMIPTDMVFSRRTYNICLVAGVCTKPEFRRRGICAELFEKAFPIMKERGFDATVLQPFRPSFYERFGYKTFILRQKIMMPNHCTSVPILSYGRTNKFVRPYDLLKTYRSFMEPYSGWSYRDENYFEALIEEYSAPDARLTVTENGCSAGYVEDGSFICTELFFKMGADPVTLLPPGFEKYVFPLPMGFPVPEGCSSEVDEFSMIKPLSDSFSLVGKSFYGFDRY